MKTFIWTIALILLFVYLRYFIYPVLRTKITYWIVSQKLRKRANQTKDEKAKKMLNDIADGVDEVNKKEKF